MKTLEEFLINEGVLVPFLQNFDYQYHWDDKIGIASSFDWDNTQEGKHFWYNIAIKSNALNIPKITKRRVQELRKEYKLVPPRYKEVL